MFSWPRLILLAVIFATVSGPDTRADEVDRWFRGRVKSGVAYGYPKSSESHGGSFDVTGSDCIVKYQMNGSTRRLGFEVHPPKESDFAVYAIDAGFFLMDPNKFPPQVPEIPFGIVHPERKKSTPREVYLGVWARFHWIDEPIQFVPGPEKYGTLSSHNQVYTFSSYVSPILTKAELETQTAEIQLSPDVTAVGQAHVRITMQTAKKKKFDSDKPDDVQEWNSPEVLTDLVCDEFKRVEW
jgi:hypothetical protein